MGQTPRQTRANSTAEVRQANEEEVAQTVPEAQTAAVAAAARCLQRDMTISVMTAKLKEQMEAVTDVVTSPVHGSSGGTSGQADRGTVFLSRANTPEQDRNGDGAQEEHSVQENRVPKAAQTLSTEEEERHMMLPNEVHQERLQKQRDLKAGSGSAKRTQKVRDYVRREGLTTEEEDAAMGDVLGVARRELLVMSRAQIRRKREESERQSRSRLEHAAQTEATGQAGPAVGSRDAQEQGTGTKGASDERTVRHGAQKPYERPAATSTRPIQAASSWVSGLSVGAGRGSRRARDQHWSSIRALERRYQVETQAAQQALQEMREPNLVEQRAEQHDRYRQTAIMAAQIQADLQWHYVMAGGAEPLQLVTALAMYLNPGAHVAQGEQALGEQEESTDMDCPQ